MDENVRIDEANSSADTARYEVNPDEEAYHDRIDHYTMGLEMLIEAGVNRIVAKLTDEETDVVAQKIIDTTNARYNEATEALNLPVLRQDDLDNVLDGAKGAKALGTILSLIGIIITNVGSMHYMEYMLEYVSSLMESEDDKAWFLRCIKREFYVLRAYDAAKAVLRRRSDDPDVSVPMGEAVIAKYVEILVSNLGRGGAIDRLREAMDNTIVEYNKEVEANEEHPIGEPMPAIDDDFIDFDELLKLSNDLPTIAYIMTKTVRLFYGINAAEYVVNMLVDEIERANRDFELRQELRLGYLDAVSKFFGCKQ